MHKTSPDVSTNRFSISQNLTLSILSTIFSYSYFSVSDFVQFGFTQMDPLAFIIPSIISLVSYLLVSEIAILLLPVILSIIFAEERKGTIHLLLNFSFFFLMIAYITAIITTISLIYRGYYTFISNPAAGYTFLNSLVGQIHTQVHLVLVSYMLLVTSFFNIFLFF